MTAMGRRGPLGASDKIMGQFLPYHHHGVPPHCPATLHHTSAVWCLTTQPPLGLALTLCKVRCEPFLPRRTYRLPFRSILQNFGQSSGRNEHSCSFFSGCGKDTFWLWLPHRLHNQLHLGWGSFETSLPPAALSPWWGSFE